MEESVTTLCGPKGKHDPGAAPCATGPKTAQWPSEAGASGYAGPG